MLKLVHPAREGQDPTRPPKRPRTRTLNTLTQPERVAVQVALRNLRRAYGSWSCVAAAMSVSEDTVERVASGRQAGSAGLALAAARASGVPIERVLSGKLIAADECPTCGRAAERRVAR